MLNLFKSYPKYKWVLAILDLTLFNISFYLTQHLVHFIKSPSDGFMITVFFVDGWDIFIPFTFLALLYFQYSNLYKIQNIFKSNAHIPLLIKTHFFVIVGLILFQLILKDFQISSRLFYIVFFGILCINFIVFRTLLLQLLGGQSLVRDRVVILGAGKKGKKLLEIFKNKIKVKKVIGFLDDNVKGEIDGVPVLGGIELARYVSLRHNVDFFILAIDKITRKRFFEIFEFFQKNNLGILVSSDYLNVLYDRLDMDIYDEFGMARFPHKTDNKVLRIIKRTFDIGLTLLGLVIISPFLLTIVILIKLDSHGPVFYRQIRIGRNGKFFYFYKFRSMYLNSDKDTTRNQEVQEFIKGNNLNDSQVSTKIVNKSRVTNVGNILRKYSLDELPQLFNVLKNDMSLVGPRPCVIEEWKVYEDWQKLRYDNATPGCTGIWQVSGRSKVDFEANVLMDIYYNKNSSPWLDIQIIFKTIPVMVLGKGGG